MKPSIPLNFNDVMILPTGAIVKYSTKNGSKKIGVVYDHIEYNEESSIAILSDHNYIAIYYRYIEEYIGDVCENCIVKMICDKQDKINTCYKEYLKGV